MHALLAAFSADDTTIKGAIYALCAAVLHLYRNDRQCQKNAADTSKRLGVLEEKYSNEQEEHKELKKRLNDCPAENCPLHFANSGTFSNPPTFCIRSLPQHPETP
jgi:hypothetical protein